MAENQDKKESKSKVTYKLGEEQLDLEQYLYNLGINVKGYMDSMNWNEGQKEEFMNSYNKYIEGLKDQLANNTGRFSADSFGRITDTQGLLSDSDNDDIDDSNSEYYYDNNGNRITTIDYNKLKEKDRKKYQTFSANRKVATYLDKVGRKLAEYQANQKEAPIEKFDLAKHGFLKYWQNQAFPTGDVDYQAILDKDAFNETDQKRGRSERAKYLAGYLENFIKQAQNYNYDFSESAFTDKNDYLTRLNTALTNLKNGVWNNNDLHALSAAGISPSVYNVLFSEEKDPTITSEQKAQAATDAEAQTLAAKKKEIEEAWEKEAARWAELHKTYVSGLNGNYRTYNSNPLRLDSTNKGETYIIDGKFDPKKWIESFSSDSNKTYNNIINNLNNDTAKNIADYLNLIFNDPYNHRRELPRALHYLIASGQNITKLDNGSYYIKRPRLDEKTGSVLIYDPASNSVYESYIGRIPHYWDQIKRKFLETKYPDEFIYGTSKKEGGILQKFQTGGNIFGEEVGYFANEQLEQQLKERAKKEGRTEKQQKAAERYINSDNKSVVNPDAGFTSAEIARLASGGADLVSAVSAWLPGAGTAVSLGTGLLSTVGNLYADVTDDSVSAWDTFKNAGLNLGMDLAGLVPGGGAAAKFAKVGRVLKGLAPKVIAVIGTGMHALNTPQYLESWGKLKSEEKLTAQDWNNILSSIQALLGPTAAVGQYAKNKGAFGKNKVEKAQRADTGYINEDKIAVKMLDQNGKEKTVLFEGEDVKAIREAQTLGKIEDLKKATIDKFDDLKDYTLNENSIGLRRPKFTSLSAISPIGNRPRHASNLIFDVTTRQGQDFVRANDTFILPGKYNFFRSDITDLSTPGMRNSDIQAAVDKRKQDIIDEMLVGSKREQKSKEKADKFLENTDKTIQDLETKIGGRKSTTIESDINNINTTRQSAEYKSRLREYTKESKQLDSLIKQKKKLEDALVEHNLSGKTLPKNPKTGKPMTKKQAQTEIAALDNAITIRTQSVNNNKGYVDSNSDTRLNDLQNQLNDVRGFEADLQAQTTRRQRIQDAYDRRWKTSEDKIFPVSREYNDFVNSHRTPEGKISWDNPHGRENIEMTLDVFNDMLKKAGVIFKEGGSLNLNRVKMFQNPAGPIEKKSVTNTTPNGVNWFTDMYMHPAMKNYFNNLNIENLDETINNFNKMQKSWSTNRTNTNYNPSTSTTVKYDKGVWDRQGEYNKTGLNVAIKDARSKINYPKNGNNLDSEKNGYQDGLFGAQEYLRHFGSKESWQGHDNELLALQNELAEKGLTYTLDEESGMYMLGKGPVIEAVVSDSTDSGEKPKGSANGITSSVTVPEDEKSKLNGENNNEEGGTSKLNELFNNPTLKYGLPRAMYADHVNRKLTNMAIEAEKPFLATPMEIHRTVHSDLNAEMRGAQAAAQLRNLSSTPRTSDASLQAALQLESELKGQDFINQGRKVSDDVRTTTAEKAWQQEKENAQMRNNIAQFNTKSLLQTQSNIAKHKMAEESKKYSNWETLSKQLEYNELAERDKNKAYEEAFIKKDISNYVTNNLVDLSKDTNLEPEAIQLYQQVQTGAIAPSELSKDSRKWNLFIKAQKVAQELESELLREHKNIPRSKWHTSRKIAFDNEYAIKIKKYVNDGKTIDEAIRLALKEKNGGVLAKNGAKIAVAQIKARTKNAELFQKQIKESIDRNEKVLDRLSKSLYGYVKASIK